MSAFGVGPGCVRACGELPDFALLVDPPINNSVKFAVAANDRKVGGFSMRALT